MNLALPPYNNTVFGPEVQLVKFIKITIFVINLRKKIIRRASSVTSR